MKKVMSSTRTILLAAIISIWSAGASASSSAANSINPPIREIRNFAASASSSSSHLASSAAAKGRGEAGPQGPDVSTDRDLRDLAAQEAMAKWAAASFWLALFQLVLSTAGFIAIVLTIRQGRSALKASQDALEHSKASSELEYRPWLDVDLTYRDAQFDVHGNLEFHAEVIIKNTGKTPARNVQFRQRSFYIDIAENGVLLDQRVRDFFAEAYPADGAPYTEILPNGTDRRIVVVHYLKRDWKMFDATPLGGGKSITPVHAVTIYYTWGANENESRTGKSFLVHMRLPNTPHSSVSVDPIIPNMDLWPRDRGVSLIR